VSKDEPEFAGGGNAGGRILSFRIEADGTLAPQRVGRMQDLAPPTRPRGCLQRPDGFKLGPDGNYYIAQNGSGRDAGGERREKASAHHWRADALRDQCEFRRRRCGPLYITGVFDPWKAPFPAPSTVGRSSCGLQNL